MHSRARLITAALLLLLITAAAAYLILASCSAPPLTLRVVEVQLLDTTSSLIRVELRNDSYFPVRAMGAFHRQARADGTNTRDAPAWYTDSAGADLPLAEPTMLGPRHSIITTLQGESGDTTACRFIYQWEPAHMATWRAFLAGLKEYTPDRWKRHIPEPFQVEYAETDWIPIPEPSPFAAP